MAIFDDPLKLSLTLTKMKKDYCLLWKYPLHTVLMLFTLWTASLKSSLFLIGFSKYADTGSGQNTVCLSNFLKNVFKCFYIRKLFTEMALTFPDRIFSDIVVRLDINLSILVTQ